MAMRLSSVRHNQIPILGDKATIVAQPGTTYAGLDGMYRSRDMFMPFDQNVYYSCCLIRARDKNSLYP